MKINKYLVVASLWFYGLSIIAMIVSILFDGSMDLSIVLMLGGIYLRVSSIESGWKP